MCPPGPLTFGRAVRQTVNVNMISEHALYLRLFITNGGGW